MHWPMCGTISCCTPSPPLPLILPTLGRILRGSHKELLIASKWPGSVWFPILHRLLDGEPWRLPVRLDHLSQLGGSNLEPKTSSSAALGLASEGPEPLLGSCDPVVVRTIHSSRAPSSNALYANRWRFLFFFVSGAKHRSRTRHGVLYRWYSASPVSF